MLRRGSGVLLHISSLASGYGIGDFGPAAYRFVDFLCRAKQGYWQVLPLTPTDEGNCNSPYSSMSAFAGNTILISPELLQKMGLLTADELPQASADLGRVDFPAVYRQKRAMLEKAYQRFIQKKPAKEYQLFCEDQAYWLDDFGLFVAIKEQFHGRMWSEWPEELRDRVPEALTKARRASAERISQEKFFQYVCYAQWAGLREYCREKGVRIIGDAPIYVTYDSVDVWTNPQIFKLKKDKSQEVVAGVPPDYFSKTGQLWGNPVYRWDVMQKNGYAWWLQRLRHNRDLFDIIRLDHFRGFVDYWQVPAGKRTAAEGKWGHAPADDFFNTVLREFPDMAIIAEDLGMLSDEVRRVIKQFDFPGMNILEFAFGEDNPKHPYQPHNFVPNSVVYTGTHDNNTVRGWFSAEASPDEKRRLNEYLGRDVREDQAAWELIRLGMMSVADLMITPLQDFLSLAADARMNTPGTITNNWQWRCRPDHLSNNLADAIATITWRFRRSNEPEKAQQK